MRDSRPLIAIVTGEFITIILCILSLAKYIPWHWWYVLPTAVPFVIVIVIAAILVVSDRRDRR